MTLLAAGHLGTDFASGALPALLPFLVDRFDLSYTLAATLMLASAVSSSLIQPLFGLWSDRRGAIWLLPTAVPPGTWLFGAAVILLGVNVARYIKHIAISGFSVAVGIAAFVVAVSQLWRTDPPLVAIFLLAIGTSLVARPLFTRTA